MDERPVCDHTNESYRTALSSDTVYVLHDALMIKSMNETLVWPFNIKLSGHWIRPQIVTIHMKALSSNFIW